MGALRGSLSLETWEVRSLLLEDASMKGVSVYWSAEEVVLVITGVLLLLVVVSSFLTRIELTATSRAAFAIGAAVFVAAAAVLARIETVVYPPLLWLLPVIPILVIVALSRDAMAGSKTAQSPSFGASVVRATTVLPHSSAGLRALTHLERERAASPSATPQELAHLAYTHPELRPTIAANPTTPANLLEWLASSGDPAITAAIRARSLAV
jgi:hypothetical protein